MTLRGRLIQQLVCVLRRVDPATTAAVPGGGYDPEFSEPLHVDDGTQLGSTSRRELPALRLRCQADRDRTAGGTAKRLTAAGQQDVVPWVLTLHRPEIEAAGLVTNGVVQIHPGDRVEALETVAGAVTRSFPVPPGLYVTGVDDGGFGLDSAGTPQVNLCYLRCEPAPLGREAR